MRFWIEGPAEAEGKTRSEMKKAAILMIFMAGFMIGTLLMVFVQVTDFLLMGQ